MTKSRAVTLVLCTGLLLHHTRPDVSSLGLKASIADWPARFATHLARRPRLEWRGNAGRNTDDLVIATVRWSRRKRYPTHLGVLGAWIRLPTRDIAVGVVILASCASYAAFSFSPSMAFRAFSPPHSGFARPLSFILAPFAQTDLMGLIFSIIAALSCGPELEQSPGTPSGAITLFVVCGASAHAIGTRLFDDRAASRCSHNGARLGWLAAVAARKPSLQFNIYGLQVRAWVAVGLNLLLAIAEGGSGASTGTVAGLASAVALGAAAGYRLAHGG